MQQHILDLTGGHIAVLFTAYHKRDTVQRLRVLHDV
jgi:hypothetical protein